MRAWFKTLSHVAFIQINIMRNPSFLILATLSSLILASGCSQKRIAESTPPQRNVPSAVAEQTITPAPTQSVVDVQMQQPPAPAPEPAQTVSESSPNSEPAEVTTLLFGFNKRELTPQMKETLDHLAAKLVDQNVESITIDGHTDHLEGGGNSSNIQKISEVRANITKEYLIRKKVPEQLINAQGKGRSQPKTQEGECKGALSRQTLVCLQPDRRVEIMVTHN